MKKIFTLLVFALLMGLQVDAQLVSGSIAPDFTATDIEGNTWNLYELLDEGKEVVLDFSTTWCGPCWEYHELGELKDLYAMYGPDGTNEMFVFMIESDNGTTLDDLYGTGPATYGDWVTGTNYPIIDNQDIADLYNVVYYPTIYHVCANRILREVDDLAADEFYVLNADCIDAIGDNNLAVISRNSPEGAYCDAQAFQPSYVIQNIGFLEATSASIELFLNDESMQVIEWTGSLETYEVAEVVFDPISITSSSEYEVQILSVNGMTDYDPQNNSLSTSLTLSENYEANIMTLELMTDEWGPETYWEMKDGDGGLIASGGNVAVVGGTGGSAIYDANTFYTHEIVMPVSGCYEFTIYDQVGDGICCDFGDGYYRLLDPQGNVFKEGGAFGISEATPFKVTSSTTISNNGSVVSYDGPSGAMCAGLVFNPKIGLQNHGGNEMTSAEIEVKANSEVLYTHQWSGNLASGDIALVSLDEVAILADYTSLSFEIVSVNGMTDDYTGQNLLTIELEQYGVETSVVTLEFQLDEYAYELYWQINNSAGDSIAAGGNVLVPQSGGGGNQTATASDPGAYAAAGPVTEEIVFPANTFDCYELVIYDDYADGGLTDLKLKDSDGNVFMENDLQGPYSEVDFGFSVTSGVVSTDEIEEVQNLKLFPNPVADLLTVKYSLETVMPLSINVYNSFGQMVKNLTRTNIQGGNQALTINVSDLTNGLYYLEMSNGGQRISRKFSVVR